MGGFPVVFIGYELEDDALDDYQPSNSRDSREAVKSLLRVVELETSRPTSIVRYDDSKGQTHKFICFFADLSGRTYSVKEIDAISVPSEFFGVPKRVKTRGELERKFSPSAMVISYNTDGKTRVNAGAVIGYRRRSLRIARIHLERHLSHDADARKLEVKDDLVNYIEGRFDITQYNTNYGLDDIGLKWMVCKVVRNGRRDPGRDMRRESLRTFAYALTPLPPPPPHIRNVLETFPVADRRQNKRHASWWPDRI